MSNKLALIYTTFIRPTLVKQTLPLVAKNTNGLVLVGDQGKEEDNIKEITKPYDNVKYFKLHYDCGLSYARNYLVEKARTFNIPYCLIMADSIYFEDKIKFNRLFKFLERDKNRGIIGMKLKGRPSWERDIELVPGKAFHLNLPKHKPFKEDKINYIQCEIIKNFFIAKTQCLIENKWDNNFKLLEHEDWFFRLKKTKWKVYFTDFIQAKYKNYKPFEYNKLRRRMYNEFKLRLRKKYKISGWVKYERGEVL